MNFSLILIFIILFSFSVFAQEISDDDSFQILTGSRVSIDYYDSWDDSDFARSYSLIRDNPIFGTNTWILDFSGRDLSLDLDSKEKKSLGLTFLDKRFIVNFERNAADSGDVRVQMINAKTSESCFSESQGAVRGFISSDVDYTSNREFYGESCGIRVAINWESFVSGSVDTDIDVEYISFDESALLKLVKEFYTKLENRRFYDIETGVVSAEQIFYHITIDYSGSSQADDLKLLTPELVQKRKDDQWFVTNMHLYRTSALPFDLDDSDERTMSISYLNETWNVEMRETDAYTVEYKVKKTSGTLCPNGSTTETITKELDITTSKWSDPVCGLSFFADWEFSTFEDDIDITEIAINKKAVGQAVANYLKGKDLAAILKFVGEMSEINSMVRAIDIYDSTKFQGDQAKRIYTGEPIFFEEGGTIDFLDKLKNRYLAVTKDKRILYIIYAKPEWGTNLLFVAKAKPGQELLLGRGGNITNSGELGDAILSMEEITGEGAELNFESSADLLATAAAQNFKETAVDPEFSVDGLSELEGPDFEKVKQKIEKDHQELQAVWNQATSEAGTSLAGYSNLDVATMETHLIGTAITHGLQIHANPASSHLANSVASAISKIQGGVTAVKAFVPKLATTEPYKDLGRLANSGLWRSVFRTGHAYELARLETSVGKFEGLMSKLVGASGRAFTAIGSAPSEVQTLRALIDTTKTKITNVKSALPSKNYSAYKTVVKELKAAKSEYGLLVRQAETAKRALELINLANEAEDAGKAIKVAAEVRKWKAADLGKRIGSWALSIGKRGVGLGFKGVWGGLKAAKMVLIPAGPVGWAVFIGFTALDVSVMVYDYTATQTIAYDDARLLLNWDREFWGTSEVKMNFLVYNGAGEYYEGPTISFFDVDETTKEKLEALGVSSLNELVQGNKIKLQLYEITSSEVYPATDNDSEIKIEVVKEFDVSGEPIFGEENAVVLNGKGTGKELSVELFEDPAEAGKTIEIIVLHDVTPGLYAAKWTVNGEVIWKPFAIGIEEYPNSPQIFPDI